VWLSVRLKNSLVGGEVMIKIVWHRTGSFDQTFSKRLQKCELAQIWPIGLLSESTPQRLNLLSGLIENGH